MLFQPRRPEKTGNSKAAGAIGLRHRPPMGPSLSSFTPLCIWVGNRVASMWSSRSLFVHWCAIVQPPNGTIAPSCLVLWLRRARGGGFTPSTTSTAATVVASAASSSAPGFVCCGGGGRFGLQGSRQRPAPAVVELAAYWLQHTVVCDLRRMVSPAPAKFNPTPGFKPQRGTCLCS